MMSTRFLPEGNGGGLGILASGNLARIRLGRETRSLRNDVFMELIPDIFPDLPDYYQRKDDGAYYPAMSKRNGLALFAALMLMAALVLLTLTLASLTLIEARQQEAARRGQALRRLAEGSALRGVAELQAALGPDIGYTWRSPTGALEMAGGTRRSALGGADVEGTFLTRWEVHDLSMGHDRAATAQAASQASSWARTAVGRAKLPHALAAGVTPRQRLALGVGGADFFTAVPAPGTTWQVRGLLTDPVRGGWRRNLSAASVMAAEVGQPLADAWRAPAFTMSPAKGYPLASVEAQPWRLTTLPVLTDLRLSLGFFNTRSDGRHRLRFHGSVVCWNPWSVPVLAGPQGKLFLVELDGAPEVTVTNLDTESHFIADLDDCPQEDFGIIRQGLRERGLWFWAEITEPPTLGMAGRGLLPGEVYAWVNPSPEGQPQGLARILTRMTWKLDRTIHGPSWRRPAPTVFLPTDRIEIAVRFRDRVSIRLRPYAGEPARDEAIADYPSIPVITLQQLSFPDFIIRTTGEDYSREDSSGYVLGERRACLRVRLRPRPPAEFWMQAGAGVFARPHWDFRVPSEAAEWTVDQPVLSALDVVDHDASPLAGPLWDLHPNRHEPTEVGAYASVRLRDFPTAPPISVGVMRHLLPPDSRAWMSLLDQAFFAAPLSVAEPDVLSQNPFLTAAQVSAPALTDATAAAGLYVVGPFNVNTRDPDAWRAFLAASICTWQPEAGGPFPPPPLSGPIFFTRPGGASLAKGGSLSAVDLADSAIGLLPPELQAGVGAQQGVRQISEAKLAAWAEKIVALQAAEGWPYPSVQAFAESRLLERSLESLNQPFEPFDSSFPIHLRAADLLEAWAPVLTVRGDTFQVIGRAEGEGGSCLCEFTVQRVPAEHPVARLGRPFRIISVRFRNP